MSASYRPAVPRKWLLGPVVGLAIVAAVLLLIGFLVPGGASIHGGWAGLLILAFAVALIIANVVELFAVAITITALVHAPELRTAANFAAMTVGAGPFLALAWWLI